MATTVDRPQQKSPAQPKPAKHPQPPGREPGGSPSEPRPGAQSAPGPGLGLPVPVRTRAGAHPWCARCSRRSADHRARSLGRRAPGHRSRGARARQRPPLRPRLDRRLAPAGAAGTRGQPPPTRIVPAVRRRHHAARHDPRRLTVGARQLRDRRAALAWQRGRAGGAGHHGRAGGLVDRAGRPLTSPRRALSEPRRSPPRGEVLGGQGARRAVRNERGLPAPLPRARAAGERAGGDRRRHGTCSLARRERRLPARRSGRAGRARPRLLRLGGRRPPSLASEFRVAGGPRRAARSARLSAAAISISPAPAWPPRRRSPHAGPEAGRAPRLQSGPVPAHPGRSAPGRLARCSWTPTVCTRASRRCSRWPPVWASPGGSDR